MPELHREPALSCLCSIFILCYLSAFWNQNSFDQIWRTSPKEKSNQMLTPNVRSKMKIVVMVWSYEIPKLYKPRLKPHQVLAFKLSFRIIVMGHDDLKPCMRPRWPNMNYFHNEHSPCCSTMSRKCQTFERFC